MEQKRERLLVLGKRTAVVRGQACTLSGFDS